MKGIILAVFILVSVDDYRAVLAELCAGYNYGVKVRRKAVFRQFFL